MLELELYVQDCVGTTPCGSLGQPYDEMYDMAHLRCDMIPWILRGNCVFAFTSKHYLIDSN